MKINLVLNKVQMKKYDGKLGFQLSAAQLHSDQPSNTRINFSSMKDYKKYEKAFRTNKGLRITPDMYGQTGAEATPKHTIPDAMNEVDIEGGALFKKLSKSINKGVSKAKKTVSKKANDIDHQLKKNVTEKKVKSAAIKTAKAGGKYVAKDLAHKAISVPITAGLTYTGVPPPVSKAIGDKASAYVSKKSGLDKKIDRTIDGLGLPTRKRGRPRAVNNGSNVTADGLTIPEHNQNIRAVRIMKGTGFLNLS